MILKLSRTFFMTIINKQSHDFSRAIWNKYALVNFFKGQKLHSPLLAFEKIYLFTLLISSKLHSKSCDYLYKPCDIAVFASILMREKR